MTFAHPLIGLILAKKFGHTIAFLAGSTLPDLDHLFVLIKHRHFKPKEIFVVMKNEKNYNEIYKTPYTHSIFAWLIISALAIFFNKNFGLAFAIGYLIHLLIDLTDTDEKQIFFPFKKRLRGFLPVFSFIEIIIGVVLSAVYFSI